MTSFPRLRPVEAFPVQQNGSTLVYLKDPLHLAEPLGVSPMGYFILSRFDGRHSLADIQEAFSKQFGTPLPGHELSRFIEMLDEHRYLLSESFSRLQRSVIEEFRGQAYRQPAHAGSVYPSDPDALKRQLDGYFTAAAGPGAPRSASGRSVPTAIVAPHIDFHRGGPAYAWAYKDLVESPGADLYILLGTSHCGGADPFILTFKDFDTPLGRVETDREFVQSLQEGVDQDLFADEYLHRGEHSIEFQAVFLKYAALRRAELVGREQPRFKIVPILVSSFHAMVANRTPPELSTAVRTFLTTLKGLAARETRRICFIAGVDLAHVGLQFGDREALTQDYLRWVESEDGRLVDRLIHRDASGFFQEIAKDGDKRRICGFAPLYCLIHLLRDGIGRELKYSQAFTPETGSAVTFTSVVFD